MTILKKYDIIYIENKKRKRLIVMKIFVDFEATQPYGEIIAIGAKAETGEEFFHYVKPQLSVSSYIPYK